MYDLEGFIGDRLYLDTNVFIYAVEGFAPYDDLLKELFLIVEGRGIQAVTSEITLAEAFVVPMREGRADLLAIYRGLLIDNRLIELIPIDRDILFESAAVRARSRAKPIDAIHVASAILSKCGFFISDDKRLSADPLTQLSLDDLANG